MKISNAYICYSCQEILDGAPQGRCCVCSSDAVYPLAWFERTEEERTNWFKLINSKREGASSGLDYFPTVSFGSCANSRR
jgi:hypothetical protein